MYENTKVEIKIAMGNIPLTIAQDATQFGYPTQPNQNNPLNEQFPTNSVQPVGFIDPAPVPGFAQQVPYGQPPFPSPLYPQQSMNPAQNTGYIQPLYPQAQLNNQSHLPYPELNEQQPTFNPSYQNLNPVVTSVPTAPSI
jgi:hypothetical protein